MIIDFHTHVFPDELAAKGLKTLLEKVDYIYEPVTDMTVTGLIGRMSEWNIDVSVVQPVITKATQIVKTNEWAKSICSEKIVSFGGIYPNTENYKKDIDFVCSLGLKGLKFHAEYQNFVLDDTRMIKIYDYAINKGLIILHHGGVDPGMPGPYKTSPKQFARIVDELKGGVIIAAHFGGHAQWDDVEEYLVGKNIYLDTSMGTEFYPREQFIRIIKAHGADRIVFASDSPWSNAKSEIEAIKSLPIGRDEIDKILGLNAKRILNIY